MIRSIEGVIIVVLLLLSVAFITIAERKTLGYIQRRVGPNSVGYLGLLMAIGDALKLLLKEMVIPYRSDKIVLLISPVISIISVLITILFIPMNGVYIYDNSISMVYILAINSISIIGLLLSGYSSNSKYSSMGSIRSTSQFISYELILTGVIIICMIMVGTLNIYEYIYVQSSIWMVVPLLPTFIIFIISCIAENGRPPFDTIEAESELVSGHMTEYSSSIFVLFYLMEYTSLLLLSNMIVILYLGENLVYKILIIIYMIILIRSALPRIRYDKLIYMCWKVLLPIIFSLTLLYLVTIIFLGVYI